MVQSKLRPESEVLKASLDMFEPSCNCLALFDDKMLKSDSGEPRSLGAARQRASRDSPESSTLFFLFLHAVCGLALHELQADGREVRQEV